MNNDDAALFYSDFVSNPRVAVGQERLGTYMTQLLRSEDQTRARSVLLHLVLYDTPKLVTLIETARLESDIHARYNAWFEDLFLFGNIDDEEDQLPPTPHSFSPEDFVRLLHAVHVATPSHNRYKAFVAVQTWLCEWIRPPVADVTGLLAQFDTVPWMAEFKANLKRLDLYSDDTYLETVTRWCLPAWQTRPDYIDRILSSRLVLYPVVPCWPVLAQDTALYAVIEARRGEDHHGWKREWHATLWWMLRVVRRRRHWAAVRAVWCGCVMWSLYQKWTLHPDRLWDAMSGLALATAPTREVMSAGARESAVSLPARFRLLDVDTYFRGA